MKKCFCLTIVFLMLFSLITNAQVIDVTLDSVNVVANGEQVTTPNILWNGSTYIPLRAVTEQLGCTVEWEDSTRTAYVGNTMVTKAIMLTKLQTQLMSIKNELWATSQIEAQIYQYMNDAEFLTSTYGQDLASKYYLGVHYNYFSKLGTTDDPKYFSFISDAEVEIIMPFINSDANHYHYVLYQSMMYCSALQSALNSIDMSITTGASKYLTQANNYMKEALNYYACASDEISNIKWGVYQLIAE